MYSPFRKKNTYQIPCRKNSREKTDSISEILDENEASHPHGTKASKPCEEKENLPLRPVRAGGQKPLHPTVENQSFVLNAPSPKKTEPAAQQRMAEGEQEI